MEQKGNVSAAVMVGIGIVILVIAMGAVAYPVLMTSVNASKLSGVDATIATYLGTFVLLAVLVGIVGYGILSLLKQ